MKKLSFVAMTIFASFCLNSAFAMPDGTETAIGRGVDAKIIKKYGAFENTEIQKYVEHVGLKIVSVSGRQDIVYHFTILDTGILDTMAAPGGYVYITKGLLLKLENEAQLAAALASEIAHIAKRHSIIDIEEGMKSQTPAVITRRDAMGYGINAAFEMAESGSNKKFQTEADIIGAEYLLHAGYDPKAMIKFLDVIQIAEREKPASVIDFLRIHRKTTKRIDAVWRMLHDLNVAEPAKYDAAADKLYPDNYKQNVLDPLNGTHAI